MKYSQGEQMSIKENATISTWRFRESSQPGRTVSIEAASDRSRIVFSEAFRMLHRKAQVFSLDDAGTARTRLTHSLEVSQIGRYLTQICLEQADQTKLERLGISENKEAIQSFVESACLVHDIGNPPFGHFGEKAICHWFQNRTDTFHSKWCDDSQHKKDQFSILFRDFTYFDGNPQGFRILTRLIWGTDKYSINLTATQLASSIKYNTPPSGTNQSNPILKKAGYFHSEQELAEIIFSKTTVQNKSRHPFVYLMEAADDIAYCLSDIEDAIKKEIFSEHEFLDLVKEKIISTDQLKIFEDHLPKKVGDSYPIGSYLIFKTKAINTIVRVAATEFTRNLEKYFSGKLPPILDSTNEARLLLNFIKTIAKERIYCSNRVLKNELIGSKVIFGILDTFFPLLISKRHRFEAALEGKNTDNSGNHISFEYALLKRIPPQYIFAYEAAVRSCDTVDDLQEHFARTHLVVDYLSGMTDEQAVETYKLLCTG